MKLHANLTDACRKAIDVATQTGESAFVVHNVDDFTPGIGFVVIPGPWDAFLETCDVVEELDADGAFVGDV